MPEEMTLAVRLKALRNAARMSQQELATRAGLSMSMVAQLEQGTKTDPRVSTLVALAKALGVDLNTLAGFDEPVPAPPKRGKRK
jgi:transcriptional regulator with XRE-family HTH domain